MREELLEVALAHPEVGALDPAERRLALRDLARAHALADPARAAATLADEIDGFGPLTPLMRDPLVTDIFVNGPGDVWIDRAGGLSRATVAFDDERHLRSWASRLIGDAGGRVDAARPIADARLADGSRLHVVVPPISPAGTVLSIRRFTRAAATLRELASGGALTSEQRDLLAGHVFARRSIVVAGATGAGKTTLMNSLLGEVGVDERVVMVEETAELAPRCPHAVRLLGRPPNGEGAGAVDLADLVRAALRMRPDRIVVGEVRGSEAAVAVEAMSTGHRGSMLTVHARSADEALDRLGRLALRPGAEQRHVRATVDRAVDVVVVMERGPGGPGYVAEIVEVG